MLLHAITVLWTSSFKEDLAWKKEHVIWVCFGKKNQAFIYTLQNWCLFLMALTNYFLQLIHSCWTKEKKDNCFLLSLQWTVMLELVNNPLVSHAAFTFLFKRCHWVSSSVFCACKNHICFFVGFSEAETRYKLSDGRTVKNAADAALPRKHKRRKTKEQPVSSVTVVVAAVQETKETLSNEKKPQRITASKKPSKYEKPSQYRNLWTWTVIHPSPKKRK